MLRPDTLAGQLTRTLVLWVGGVWLACVAGVVWYADREINFNFDSELVEVSHRMFEIALDRLDRAPSDAQRPVIEPAPRAFADAAVLFRIVDANGRILMRSAETPADIFNVPVSSGFADTAEWRIYTVHHPQRSLYLQVADPLEERSSAVNRTLVGLLVPLIAVLPLLALLLRRIARDELRVLQQLSGEIGRRGGNRLEPIQLERLPRELQLVSDHVNRLLERLSQSLDVERALAANAAHELRTPLAAARLRLHTALEESGGPERQTHVQAALQSLETLSQRAEKLLQLSRAETGGALGREPVSLPALAGAVVDEFWSDITARHPLALEVDEQGVMPVHGDADALAIALRNLIENALRHGRGSLVEVEARAPATLVVRDAGPGVPASQIASLVKRHVRKSSDRAGYGLGLSIVTTIVEKHGGRLELESPPPGREHGLEARLVLPPASAEEESVRPDAPASSPASARTSAPES
jgi:two-component system OmpR family sensor kinase